MNDQSKYLSRIKGVAIQTMIHPQPVDAKCSTGEVIATQRRCHKKQMLVSKESCELGATNK